MTDNNITFHSPATEEIIRLDKEGFHYRGQFIADAGEAHRLMVEFLKQNTQPAPQGPTDEELLAAYWEAFKDTAPCGAHQSWLAGLRAVARAALAQPEPQGPTDEELLAAAAATIDPYQNSGIAIGEYEVETECALEVYGSELITFARAVLARWGRPAIKPVPQQEAE